jgi:hypothetical protein
VLLPNPHLKLLYTAHVVMTAHKISVANMLCKGAKNYCLKSECTIQICATAYDSSVPSSGVVFPAAFQNSACAWF